MLKMSCFEISESYTLSTLILEKRMFGLFLLLSLCFIGANIVAWIMPHAYFSELVLSFLPYSIALSVLGLVGSLIIWIIYKKQIKGLRSGLFIMSVMWYLVVGFLFLRTYMRFYALDVPQIKTTNISWYKVVYGNIYKDNQDYTWLKNMIDQEDPDLIFFVEFSDHHSHFFQQECANKYPYSNRTSWSKEFIWSVVFSKVPIKNRANDFPQWAWRYAYFSVDYEGTPIYFYLVHTSSPIRPEFFVMRNTQIQTFFHDFDLHQQIHRSRNDKVIVLWDFNTTPWSVYYKEFAQWFSGDFINVTRDFPLLFTWRFLAFPFLWAQIDHVFVNHQVQISDFAPIEIPWSDHRWFHFVVR